MTTTTTRPAWIDMLVPADLAVEAEAILDELDTHLEALVPVLQRTSAYFDRIDSVTTEAAAALRHEAGDDDMGAPTFGDGDGGQRVHALGVVIRNFAGAVALERELKVFARCLVWPTEIEGTMVIGDGDEGDNT